MTSSIKHNPISIAVNILKIEEGYRAKPYLCSEGYPTVGIGQRIGSKGTPLSVYEFTCSESVAEQWLSETVSNLENQLIQFNWYQACNSERKAILISMAYQIGMNGLLGFSKMLSAIETMDWETASIEGRDSLWASQTPERAHRHMTIMRGIQVGEVY